MTVAEFMRKLLYVFIIQLFVHNHDWPDIIFAYNPDDENPQHTEEENRGRYDHLAPFRRFVQRLNAYDFGVILWIVITPVRCIQLMVNIDEFNDLHPVHLLVAIT